MPRYGSGLTFHSPGAAMSDALEALMLKRELERRQAMLDALAAEDRQRRMAREDEESTFKRGERAFAQSERERALAAREQAEESEARVAPLRLQYAASQNLAGTDDPQGAAATRNALRIAMQAAGAKDVPDVDAGPKRFSGTLSPGQVRYENGEIVAEAEKPEEAPAVGSFEDYVTQLYGPRPTPQQIAQARRDYGDAGRALRIDVGGGQRQLTPTAESNLITKLATQWDKATADDRALRRQFAIMKTGVDRFEQDPNGASQAVLVTFQKILDPTSVVRESEYARSADGVSLMQRMQGYAERLAAGGAGVPKAQLQEMVRTAERFIANTKDGRQGLRRRLAATADRYGLPHELVFDDGGASTGPNEAPATATQVGSDNGSVIQVKAPNGKVYTFDTQAQADAFKKAAGIQ